MQFYFSYPLSETQSYYLLQDCLVALYYQMYFLKHMTFSAYTDGEGWGYCKYGDGVECEGKDGKGCTSWICPEAVTKGKEYADAVKEKNEVEKQKKEKKKEQKDVDEAWGKVNEAYQKVINQTKCGQNGQQNPSPLQAFLTDCLKGFTCPEVMDKGYKGKLEELRKSKDEKAYQGAYPGFLDHRRHLPVGQECAVPMGFSGSFREKSEGSTPGTKDGMIGLGIRGVLNYYSNDDVYSSGLYQITRCICSLTRRVPRSTGTLYGFFYGLGGILLENNVSGQGQKNANVMEFKDAFTKELSNGTPSVGGDSGELIKVVGTWRGSKNDHKKDAGKCSSLSSLSDCKGAGQSGQTCGKYLHPLTGSLYNSVATQYCDTYLSWILYLAGVLKTGLESLLVEFRNINCKEAGCKDSKGGKSPCKCPEQGCKKGTHGVVKKEGEPRNEKGCCCDNVVQCAGVHPLFYRFGFSLKDPNVLTGNASSPYDKLSRECSKFYDRLQKVLEGPYYKELSKQLRKFMYSTRALFGVYIGVYWLAVLVYLLWSMTVNLDLMHIQSHWRSPGSYLVPLQRILADGSRNVKRVCTIGYFQEANGDSLLSQGVSDVYL